MKPVINESQKREIGALAVEHSDALIAILFYDEQGHRYFNAPLEQKNGRVIYDTIEKLATALRVRRIIPVPIMEDLSRVSGANTHLLGGIYVNLTDYNVGADKGGAVSMFDDFDIDYNAQKYLIETRCSGALIKPYSAVAIEFVIKTEELTAEELAA